MPNKNLLTPEIIPKLNNLYLKARFVVEGFMVGLHKSPYHGFSVEFSEHRAYGAGDEIRYIDWKLWGKTDRFFVKQFEEETNLKAYILFDHSSSMFYKSTKINKWEYAQTLAASLGYLIIKQQDAIGLTMFDDQINVNVPAHSKKSHLNIILSHMQNISGGSKTNIAPILHHHAETIKKRGLIILISDLFDNQDNILSGLQHFRYKGHEVIVFHILDPQELKLNFPQRTRFRDMETGQELVTDPWFIQSDYRQSIEKFCDYYKINCRKKKIDYIQLTTDLSLHIALSEYLLKRKKIGG